jgi:Tol biopolymer transport system component
VLNPGGPPTLLTSTPGMNEGSPRWSPDGQKLAFTRQQQGADTSQMFVRSADGSDERKMADETCHQFEWLPDSQRIMCWAGDTVWLLGLDGSMPRGLRVQDPENRFSSWSVDDLSPDGTQLLLEQAILVDQLDWPPLAPEAIELWRLDLLSGELRPMVRREGVSNGQARWSPDGSRIVFATEDNGATGYADSISLLAADGSGQRELVPPTAGVVVRRPTWAPDGSAVFYESRSTLPNRADGVWAVNVETATPRLVAEGWTIAAPGAVTVGPWQVKRSDDAWSPDGRVLVVHDLQEGVRKLFTIESDGSNLSELLDCLCPFDWQPLRP